jgi:hypothetical protein
MGRPAVLLADLGLWIGGLVIGFIVVVVGAAVGSTLVVRLGLLAMTAGMAGSALVRLLALRAGGSLRASGLISVGFRLAVALLFFYLLLNFQLSAKTQP